MIKKTDDFILIEQCFGEIKAKNNIDANIKRIERTLKRIFDLSFNISIVDNTTNAFFGMNIFPSVSTMDVLIESIVDKKSTTDEILKIWQTNDVWYVEVDSILLWDLKLGANPAEITAILLHEIGHIVYDSSIPRRLHKVLRYQIMKLDYRMRALIAEEKIRKLFNITILDSCTTKSFAFVNTKTERIADSFVIKYGYGNDLDTFIGKLISTQGNSLMNKTEGEMDSEIKSTVNWTINNIKELECRKKHLRTAIKVEMLKTPSVVIKQTLQTIHTSFFGEANDKYRELLSEQYVGVAKDTYAEMQADQNLDRFVQRVLTEATDSIFDKMGKVKKITQSDIDILMVEAENIQNTDDKIYLLDRLYNYMEIVNTGLDLIEMGKERRVSQSKTTLMSFKDQLNKIRDNIVAMKILDKEYGVFIRYPKGYQG